MLIFLPIIEDTFDTIAACNTQRITMSQLVHASGGRAKENEVQKVFMEMDTSHDGVLELLVSDFIKPSQCLP
jgi:Ca2+-binding EF-hand superfamily protein